MYRYQFPTADEIRRWQRVKEKRCPHCGSPDVFDTRRIKLMDPPLYVYKCRDCQGEHNLYSRRGEQP